MIPYIVNVKLTVKILSFFVAFLEDTNFKVEIFLEQREVAFLSLSKICKNLNILLGAKNATSLSSKIIFT